MQQNNNNNDDKRPLPPKSSKRERTNKVPQIKCPKTRKKRAPYLGSHGPLDLLQALVLELQLMPPALRQG